MIGSVVRSNTYVFSGHKNEVVDFTLVATNGSLVPKILLYNPNGSLNSSNYSGAPFGCGGSTLEMNTVTLPVTGTYTVKVALPNAPDAMRLGAVVTGSAEVRGEPVAVIPTGALLQSGNQPAVWVVSPTGKTVHRQPVNVLRFDPETVTVSKGLKEGDLVVTAGVNWLAEGQKVSLPTEIAQ